ncbi:hypothetical protein [Deinococcus enclensis]|uniref:Uncharacterized protein n=1 Tax=Deinococcus enclensis TaxID=1049582 RepID=A0ABT9MF44_9DEIO|nr:hypothetical protein [Deinococcus enclensis]MDP9765213.1 hypothetical protein [Deinococcus enclensis]
MLTPYIRHVGGFALGWTLVSVLCAAGTGTLASDRPFDWAMLAVGTAVASVIFAVRRPSSPAVPHHA